ncbi:MAG: cell division protein FtsQ/DivIB, partial [Rhodothermaceae bacterium]
TRDGNYPIILNPFMEDELKLFNFVGKNEDIRTAFKMIYAMKLINPELLDNISEIDLREGRDIVVTLIDSSYPVIIGRENEVTKIAYLNRIWKFLKDEDSDGVLEYIDFRYDTNVYLGLS